AAGSAASVEPSNSTWKTPSTLCGGWNIGKCDRYSSSVPKTSMPWRPVVSTTGTTSGWWGWCEWTPVTAPPALRIPGRTAAARGTVRVADSGIVSGPRRRLTKRDELGRGWPVAGRSGGRGAAGGRQGRTGGGRGGGRGGGGRGGGLGEAGPAGRAGARAVRRAARAAPPRRVAEPAGDRPAGRLQPDDGVAGVLRAGGAALGPAGTDRGDPRRLGRGLPPA